jgi:hypothetical protein
VDCSQNGNVLIGIWTVHVTVSWPQGPWEMGSELGRNTLENRFQAGLMGGIPYPFILDLLNDLFEWNRPSENWSLNLKA